MRDNTIFDDVFRTMMEKMTFLVVPLINDVFHTSYPADVEIVQLRNEYQRLDGEIITDSRLLIGNRIYHIECQSTGDAEMVIRMIEYDFAVSLETKQIENGRYKIYFPHSCVLYLRGKGRKDTLGMDIIMPDGRVIKYELPAIYIERYTQDVIFQKKLLFLLPFYVIRYEKSREDIEKDPEKLQKLLDEYVTISRRLEESLLENGKEALHRYLVEVIIKIADYIFSDSEKTKKGVDRAMGGEVLELKTDKLINEIRQDVKEEVKEEIKTETKEKIVICMLKRGKSTLEEIAADTQMPIEQVERIKKEQQL